MKPPISNFKLRQIQHLYPWVKTIDDANALTDDDLLKCNMIGRVAIARIRHFSLNAGTGDNRTKTNMESIIVSHKKFVQGLFFAYSRDRVWFKDFQVEASVTDRHYRYRVIDITNGLEQLSLDIPKDAKELNSIDAQDIVDFFELQLASLHGQLVRMNNLEEKKSVEV